ncbi:MAG TPA: ECF-type sigma factor [Gemmatimonadales bacterium]|nr:ECF-type sigma factor [Gemmatimonadales bacterium]
MSLDAPIGELVRTADSGNPEAVRTLFAELYRELHAIAARELRRANPAATLSTTTLLHEAFLRLSARDDLRFTSQAHFLAYACTSMRRLLIDFARCRRAQKRGGEFVITTLPPDAGAAADADAFAGDRLDQLNEALDSLAEVEPVLAQLVDLHVFCGVSLVEAAALRGVTDRTVQRDWQKARLLLHAVLGRA